MKLPVLFAVIVSTCISLPARAEDRHTDPPEIWLLREQGALFGRVRSKTKTSAGRITAVSLGRKWNGGDDSLKAISGYSVMLLSLHRSPKVSDATLLALRGLEVKYIKLHQVQVTDKGLDHVATMTGVKTLTLKDVPVTDKGVPALARMKNLKRLNLWATKMSHKGVAKLRAALPDCEIHANWW